MIGLSARVKLHCTRNLEPKIFADQKAVYAEKIRSWSSIHCVILEQIH